MILSFKNVILILKYRNKRLNSWLNIGISGGEFVQISELNYLCSDIQLDYGK